MQAQLNQRDISDDYKNSKHSVMSDLSCWCTGIFRSLIQPSFLMNKNIHLSFCRTTTSNVINVYLTDVLPRPSALNKQENIYDPTAICSNQRQRPPARPLLSHRCAHMFACSQAELLPDETNSGRTRSSEQRRLPVPQSQSNPGAAA